MISPTKSHAGTIASIAEISRETAELPPIENEHIRIASILEQSLNEIYLFNTQTLRFEYVNKCAQRNLGYSMDRLRMMTPMDIKPDIDEASLRIMADPLLRGEKEVLIFETVHLRSDGTFYPVEVHLQLFEQSGWLGFLAMVFDITVRCRAEAALRESEAWFRTMANTIPQLAWIAGADGSRSWYNQRWY
ncbi:MAG: PAS domain S-box protein, partial [Nitrosospira sp.]